MEELESLLYSFALRKYDFRGQWSATLKNRGRSKKTQELTALKSGGSSLPVGTYLQRGSAPPPPPWRMSPVLARGRSGGNTGGLAGSRDARDCS